MFDGCLSLKTLNIYNFNFDQVTEYNYIFGDCSKKLKKIIKVKNAKAKKILNSS